MSAFDDWYYNDRPPMYSVHTDRQSQDRCIAEQAFDAGMERAAVMLINIANSQPLTSDRRKLEAINALMQAATAIRKEIEK